MPLVLKVVWRGAVVFLWAAGIGVSQSNSTFVAAAGQIGFAGGTMGFGPAGISPLKTITGLPYSAEQVTENVQTLADGTHITQKTQSTMMYRDSAGRTRTEHNFTSPSGLAIPGIVEITDAVAGYRYMLQAQNRVAHRSVWPPVMHPTDKTNAGSARPAFSLTPPPAPQTGVSGNPIPPSATRSQWPHPEMKSESLGTQTIDAITAQGTRTTVTFAVGSMGNDQPITSVSEIWRSPELNLMVMSKNSDPRTGESTTKLKDFSQVEPDPALFQVPADYTVEEMEPAKVVR